MLPDLTKGMPDGMPGRRYWTGLWLLVVLLATVSAAHHIQQHDLAQARAELETVQEQFDTLAAIDEVLVDRLRRADALLADLFGHDPETFKLSTTLSYQVDITAYSLSPNETDSTPLEAAFGPSRPFMAALSDPLIRATGLRKGDRFAVLSDDGEVRAVCIFWDRMNPRWEDMRVDIVAPAAEVALWHGIKPGRLVKVGS